LVDHHSGRQQHEPHISLHSITRAAGAGLRGRHRFRSADHRQRRSQKVPMATGIDALFAPFVVAAGTKMFEKYDGKASSRS
jgi:hypothetical protein